MVDFSGFSSESFEQFIRAIATKLIGPGVTAYGDGPDGGREATFSGKVTYPFPPLQQWDGYGVFQAKFKSSTEGNAKDQAWAIQQAKNELEKWLLSAKRKPKVEYFIFCTNISLSSASGGGKDKLTKLLKLKKYGLKDHAIWDLNQLRVYIDNAADIRNRFRALFTPGDLLAAFADKLQMGDGVDVEAVLSTFITREFLVDEDARLSQAGDRSEDRIRLADVFVDLPSGPQASAEPTAVEIDGLQPASLCELLRAGAHKLDPLALLEEREALKTDADRLSGGPIARFVYLGGPGSGKSTIGQALAQIHRAALLNRRPTHRLEDNIRRLVQTIKERCDEDGYDWPKTPRYPFRVELNYFAKALSANTEIRINSLSEYLRKALSKNTLIKHEHLRSWLATYPCLLILDGLDEVPASSNRKQVIEAIQEFLNEARELECDLQIVASSRPDGYAGEFDGGEVAHRHLHPLSAARAIRCAEKYVHAKIAKKDDHRAAGVMDTLRASINNPLIAKLMYSPLQVTFMVTVVAASGKPSESRWRLFSEYYKTIYERELQKAVPPFDKALSARRSDIDALHHRVGFILQNRAEVSGGTQSDMPISEFKSLVSECLGELGLSSDLLADEVEMIVGAANERLVFLTSRTPGRLSFDVRSLQEYMAAACLTNADSTEAIQRLMQIGHSAYWRNVTMFGVGRFFDEPQLRTQRDKIRLLCEDLNQQPGQKEKGLIGSRLAADILSSGVMGDVPVYSRALGKIALELLEFPPANVEQDASSIAVIYKAEMQVEYQHAITLRLGQSETDRSIAAWWALNHLIENNVPWASALWLSQWPKEMATQQAILISFLHTRFGLKRVGRHLTKVLTAVIPQLEPTQVLDLLRNAEFEPSIEIPEWLSALSELLHIRRNGDELLKIYQYDESIGVEVRLNRLDDMEAKKYSRLSSILEGPLTSSTWSPIDAIAKFVTNPTRDLLSQAAACIAKDKPNLQFWQAIAPWPIKQLLNAPQLQASLMALPSDTKPWLLAEEQFNKNGLELSDLLQPNIELGCVDFEDVLTWIFGDHETRKNDRGLVFLKSIFAALSKIKNSERRNKLSNLFFGASSITNKLQDFDPTTIGEIIFESKSRWALERFSLKINAQEKVSPAWEKFFIKLGALDLAPVSAYTYRQSDLAIWSLQRFATDPTQLELLKIAGLSASSFSQKVAKDILKHGYDLKKVLRETDDIQIKFAAVTIEIMIAGGELDRVRFAANELRTLLQGDQIEWGIELILDVISRNQLQDCGYLEIIDSVVASDFGKKWSLRSRAEALRARLIEDGSSGFSPTRLIELSLPTGHL